MPTVHCWRPLHLDNDSSILGMRPGELLDCVHAKNDSGGCGTSEFCRVCGAVNAVLQHAGNKMQHGPGMQHHHINGPSPQFPGLDQSLFSLKGTISHW